MGCPISAKQRQDGIGGKGQVRGFLQAFSFSGLYIELDPVLVLRWTEVMLRIGTIGGQRFRLIFIVVVFLVIVDAIAGRNRKAIASAGAKAAALIRDAGIVSLVGRRRTAAWFAPAATVVLLATWLQALKICRQGAYLRAGIIHDAIAFAGFNRELNPILVTLALEPVVLVTPSVVISRAVLHKLSG